jgi:site-specific DNA recombinase
MNEDLPNYRFAIYARKSEIDDGRQILSIPSQIQEMRDLARSLGFRIVLVLSDSQTAHKPNKRPNFAKLLDAINEGKIDGILCWKADRLARNPIESGTILYLIQTGLIKIIQTPFARFLPTDNMLPLNIELGMANQYSLDLAKNIRRGNKAKTEQGGWCHVAVQGYLNDRLEKTILKDPDRFHLVRKMWDLLLTEAYSIPQICRIANDEWNYKTRRSKKRGGNPLAVSTLYGIFCNPFYYGRIENGEHQGWGTHEPMITEEEFELAQEILGRAGRKGRTGNEFPFTGIVHCGECNSSITAEIKVKYPCPSCTKQQTAKNPQKCRFCKHMITEEAIFKGKWYTYYRCTKKKGACSQAYVEQSDLKKQVLSRLQQIQLKPNFEAWAKKWFKARNEEEFNKKSEVNDRFGQNYARCEARLKGYIDMRADGELNKEEFLAKKAAIEKEMIQWKKQLKDAEVRRDQWLQKVEKELDFVVGITARFNTGTIRDKRYIFSELGSNFVLKDKELAIEGHPHFVLFKELEELADLSLEPDAIRLKTGKDPMDFVRGSAWSK